MVWGLHATSGNGGYQQTLLIAAIADTDRFT